MARSPAARRRDKPRRPSPDDRPPPPPSRPSARDAAYRRLAIDAERFPEIGIAPLETPGLDGRDAALARAIHRVAVRRWLTLRRVISGYLKPNFEDIEPSMRAVLLGGAAQLLFLDRVPDHAVLDESVEWAKRNIRPGAGGMVNAVLRRVASSVDGRVDAWEDRPDLVPLPDGGALKLTKPLLQQETLPRWSAAFSLPTGLLRKWAEDIGEEGALVRARHAIVEAPITLSVPDGFEHADETAPHDTPGSVIYTGDASKLGAWLDARTGVWAQDAGSSESLSKLAGGDWTGKLIVDWCAGKGTKTRQLARLAPGARIVACDPDEARAGDLEETARRLDNTEAMTPDEARRACDGRADLVVLDVPCSNTGVLPRRPEAAYRALYGHAPADARSEVAAWRVVVEGPRPPLAPAPATHGGAALKGRRRAWTGARFEEVPVLDRYALSPGAVLEGPCIVEERVSTAVIAGPARVEVDRSGALIARPGLG